MGTIGRGVLGGFNGKAGTALGSSWKNLSVLRSRPLSKRRGLPSDLQLRRQAKRKDHGCKPRFYWLFSLFA
jgi:hypothetical protein